jgi:TatD DNase family protein
MLFDTHAHYYDQAFDPDRDAVLTSLPQEDVGLVLCPGCDLATSRESIRLAEQYPHLYAAAGVHPEDALGLPEDWLAQVEEMARRPKVKAIGEIGLDYYWKEVPRDLQKEVFRAQLALAERLDLPVIVHDREAHADSLAIVREFPGVRGVFHCYSGSAEDAKTLVKLGWHLSFTGTITFKNARKAPEVIAAVPLDRIMVETDAPYMAPVPFRGKRCDSRYVYRMAETIAQIKGLTFEEVARITTENGKKLFAIDDTESRDLQ